MVKTNLIIGAQVTAIYCLACFVLFIGGVDASLLIQLKTILLLAWVVGLVIAVKFIIQRFK